MTNFADRIIEAVKQKQSHVCVGLDPRWKRIPKPIREKALSEEGRTKRAAASAIIEFNKILIEAVSDKAVAVKPQIAFYELYRQEGIKAFWKTVSLAREHGLLVIADIKRSDIGTTAEAYAQTYLSNSGGCKNSENHFIASEKNKYGADAVTLNPYFGRDSIEPFLDRCQSTDKNEKRGGGRGIFILVRTSNPSAGEIQGLPLKNSHLGGESDRKENVCTEVARLVAKLGENFSGKYGYSAAGAVVAVTGGGETARLRQILNKNYFLCPGYGAQGGGAEDVVPAFNRDGLGAIITSSRGINYAYEKKHFSDDPGEAAREAADAMRSEINLVLEKADRIAW